VPKRDSDMVQQDQNTERTGKVLINYISFNTGKVEELEM
jgi:hypothetical protein